MSPSFEEVMKALIYRLVAIKDRDDFDLEREIKEIQIATHRYFQQHYDRDVIKLMFEIACGE